MTQSDDHREIFSESLVFLGFGDRFGHEWSVLSGYKLQLPVITFLQCCQWCDIARLQTPEQTSMSCSAESQEAFPKTQEQRLCYKCVSVLL